MGDENQLFNPEGCGADAAAYALGALEPAEAEAFERHLEQCFVCAEDLDTFERVTGALAMSTPQHPMPSDVRRRVIDSIRTEPRPTLPIRRGGSWFPRSILPRVRHTAIGTAIAAAVIAIVMLLSEAPSDVRVVAASVRASSGSAQVRLAGGRAELIVRHFRPPPAGMIYEVWQKRTGRPLTPTGVLFSVTAQGTGDIGLPGQIRGVSEILVTPEPAGGSPAPTHQPVIDARLS